MLAMDSNIAFEIAETALVLRREFDRRAAELGVTRAQWRVLSRLSRQDGLRQVELAEALDVEPITLCRMIDRLEEAGLVTRHADPADRRAWRLHITTAARPLVEKLRRLADDMAAEAFASIDPKELETTRRVLAQIRENAGANIALNRASNE